MFHFWPSKWCHVVVLSNSRERATQVILSIWLTRETQSSWSAYDTNFFISLFERAFKMMKNGVYFIVIALLVAELFKILVYAN